MRLKKSDKAWVCLILVSVVLIIIASLKQEVDDAVDNIPQYYYHALKLEKQGIKELPGDENHPWIINALKSVGIKGELLKDSTPWCGSGMNLLLANSGFKGTNSGLAKAFLTWGKSIDEPKKGAIAVWFNGQFYHVNILLDANIKTDLRMGPSYMCIGPNQSKAFKRAPYLIEQLVDIRWPTDNEVK